MSAAVTPLVPRPVRRAFEDRVDLAFEKFYLPNGLTVIVHENRAVPLVTVNIWYKVGAKDEAAGKTGLAHLFEHLMFGGSANMPGSYLNNMGQVGAIDMNGTTNPDRTNFYQTVRTGALDAALFAESDRMGHFLDTLGPAVLEQQRQVVLNEKDETHGAPFGGIAECMARGLFPADHPYAHTTIGWREDVERLTLEDARGWFRAHYAPSNAVLALSGDIDLDTAREKAMRFFGDIPPGPPLRRPVRWVPAARGARREVLEDNVPQARIVMAWNIPPAGDRDCTALSLALPLIGRGVDSLLYRRTVEKDHLALDVSASFAPMMLSGQFAIFADAAPGADIATLETAIREELDRFRRDGPDADALERVKIGAEAGLIRQLQTGQAVADLLAMNEVYFGDPGYYLRDMEWLAGLDVDDVRRAAEQWLGEVDYTLHVVPHGSLTTAGPGVDRAEGAAMDPPAGIALPAICQARLSNGIRVLIAERRDLPLVDVRLLFPRGATSEPRDRLGVAQLTAGLMGSGAGERDAVALRDTTDRNAIMLGAGIGIDASSATMSALRSRLELGLDLLADLVRRPCFDAAEVERAIRLRLASLPAGHAAPGAAVARLLPGLLFGTGHPYARPGEGLPDTIAAITRDDIVAMHRRIFDPANATVVVTGDVTLAEIVPLLERRFGNWASTIPPMRPSYPPARTGAPGVYLIDRPGAPQAAIAAALVIPSHRDVDPIALTVVDQVLGGTFGSRINMNLREDKSWTYGVRSEIGATLGERAYILSGAIQADRVAEAMIEIRREYRELVSTGPITEHNLAVTRQSTIMGLAVRTQTLGALANTIETLVRMDRPLDYWDNYAERMMATDLDTVAATALRIIRPEELIWVVAGDLAQIESGIRAAGLGSVHLVASDDDSRYRDGEGEAGQ